MNQIVSSMFFFGLTLTQPCLQHRFRNGNRGAIAWNESVRQFIHEMRQAGGHVRSLRTSRTTDGFIAKYFAAEKAKEPVNGYTPDGCAKYNEKTGRNMGEETCDAPPHTGQHNTECQANWNVLQGWRAFQAYALTSPHSNKPYSWVLRTREDVGYYAPVNISLAKRGVTYFKPCEAYGGISDKGWMAPPEHAALICEEMLMARYTQLNHAYQENSEQLLWQIVNYHAIPYAPVKVMCSERTACHTHA
jgi:hypothetical protein